MSIFLDTMRKLSRTAPLRWTMSKIQTPLDMRFKGTRFAFSRVAGGDVPLCYLSTTGARSGRARTVPLTYMPVGAGYAVVATNYGRDRHPGWSYNLDATPAASLEIDETSIDVTARRATDDELGEIWPKFDHYWPGYEEYREIAPRDIRVYVLEPESA